MSNQVRVGVAVAVHRVLNNKQYVLLGKRKGSHGAGTWSFPGGHLEYGEKAIETAFRELEEETGITKSQISYMVKGPYVETVFEKEEKHYITLLFHAGLIEESFAGVQLREPDKCEHWLWCTSDNLPSPLFEPIINSEIFSKYFQAGEIK